MPESLCLRKQLLYELHSFDWQFAELARQACDVPTRECQARGIAQRNWIATCRHDDGNRRSSPFDDGSDIVSRSDYGSKVEAHQLRGEFRKPFRMAFGRTPLDDDALAFDVSELTKPTSEGFLP